MARSFSEYEKENIRQRLYEKGKESLLQYGIKKSNIEEITKAVGVSKGTFYSLFNSKEEFFFDIFEIHDRNIKARVFEVLNEPTNVLSGLREFLKEAVLSEESIGFYSRMVELEQIMIKLPPERIANHLNEDNDSIIDLMRFLQVDFQKCDPMIVSNLTKVLILTVCSRHLLNVDVLEDTCDLLIDKLIDYISLGIGG
ncbi:TetR/AcrR family transcriptional regulator [Alkalicella caledoniensis]|uniref:TetR/AcrR family transcriptional regulator n=1 Tax=Alkalicella caledoniensis TaxID=2731377 RepID=A0A7G9W7L0_ALKCA|nr:TetR/AcrR family transcriptional regulator [Alkalicella caledoniensis]QNO14672.1 TetR/AcrR family transcriptional regulator [Alkalicella caledoniensis]